MDSFQPAPLPGAFADDLDRLVVVVGFSLRRLSCISRTGCRTA